MSRRRPNKCLLENPPAEQIFTQQLFRVQLRLDPQVAIPNLLNTDTDRVLDAQARLEPSAGARNPDLVRWVEEFHGVGVYGGCGIGGEESEDEDEYGEDGGELEDDAGEDEELEEDDDEDENDASAFLTGAASLTLNHMPLDIDTSSIGKFLQVADENEDERDEDPDADDKSKPLGDVGEPDTNAMDPSPLTLRALDRNKRGQEKVDEKDRGERQIESR